MKGCKCVPDGEGFYWATHRLHGYRMIVQVGKNGHGHMRVYMCRDCGHSFGLEEWKDYRGPLKEAK